MANPSVSERFISKWPPDDALVRCPYERQHHVFVFRHWKFQFGHLHGLRHVVVQDVKRAVNVFNGLDSVDLESSSSEPNAIDPDVAQRFAGRLDEWEGHFFEPTSHLQ